MSNLYEKRSYSSPSVEIVEVAVEAGYSLSFDAEFDELWYDGEEF